MKMLLAMMCVSGVAYAFPTGGQFDSDPMTTDGAGGIPFDGAPRWTGHSCVDCHTDPPGQIGVRIESDHPELFSDGYKPGMQYHMRVMLLDQHEAVDAAAAGDNCGFAVTPYTRCDQNGFALELDNALGASVGKFAVVSNNACVTGMAPSDVDAYILKDGTAVTHVGAHHAQTQWDVCWTAPTAGTGALTAYVAVVDGNGGDGTENFPADTTNDNFVSGAVPIAEQGGSAPPTQTGGCDAGGEGGLVLALAVLALLPRRRVAALLLALATVGACGHVRPRERETLARRNMKFAPDPIEDELDLHMQEAREGSSGGYGSSGGGCGCN